MNTPKTENEIRDIIKDWDSQPESVKEGILSIVKGDSKFSDLMKQVILYGRILGFPNILDKYKWREVIMAEKLNHVAHDKASAGKDSDNYASDATDSNGKKVEYKTQNPKDSKIRKMIDTFLGIGDNDFTVTGVYNGAYKQGAIEAYRKISHEYGTFNEEELIFSIKPNIEFVTDQLTENRDANNLYMETGCMRKDKNGKYLSGPSRCKEILRSFNRDVEKAKKHIQEDLGYNNRVSSTTNCNSVNVKLIRDKGKYVYTYVNEEWFKRHGVDNIIQILTDEGMYNAD